ncbi:hypothetical protein T4D_8295 [Trichinella pseudospiralis]|uniref:Uncharacterized protein n=1 Tax=Trichinella pseudospiralis TaxID=6337 RepID=A0A0V1FTQ1_TRIPS|nr:hypothetical protein T4D_8295 [Trichinella pseudospiralis]
MNSSSSSSITKVLFGSFVQNMDSRVEYCQSGCLFDVAQCRCPVIVRHVRLHLSTCIRPPFLLLLLLLLLLPLLLLLLPPVVGQLWTLISQIEFQRQQKLLYILEKALTKKKSCSHSSKHLICLIGNDKDAIVDLISCLQYFQEKE